MGRGCRGQALPRCFRAAAARREPSCSATGRCGRTPSGHCEGPRRSGSFADRSQEGMPAGASLGCGLAVDPWGEIQPRGSVASLACPCPPPPPPPSHQLIQEGRRRDAPSSAKKRFPTPMCHTMTWHHGIPAVGPHRARRGKRWHHPWLRWRGKVGFPPLIPPRRSFCAP